MWGVWGIVSKAATKVASDATILVLSTLGVVPAGLAMLLSKNLQEGKNRRLGCAYAFATGVCGHTGNLMMLQSLSSGGDTSIVLPLTGMFPLATVLLAVVILKERLNAVQVGGIGVALAALYLFNAAGSMRSAESGGLQTALAAPWMRSALAALVLWGVAGVLQKLATNQISAELSTLCFTLAFVPVAAVVAAMFEVRWQLTPEAWLLVLLFGALIGFGTLVLFAAYREGKASVVTPVYALYPAVTVLLAVPIFREKIDLWRGVGIVLALVAAVALSHEKPEKSDG